MQSCSPAQAMTPLSPDAPRASPQRASPATPFLDVSFPAHPAKGTPKTAHSQFLLHTSLQLEVDCKEPVAGDAPLLRRNAGVPISCPSGVATVGDSGSRAVGPADLTPGLARQLALNIGASLEKPVTIITQGIGWESQACGREEAATGE